MSNLDWSKQEASNQHKRLHLLRNSHHSYLPFPQRAHHLSMSVHHPQLQHSEFYHCIQFKT